MNSILDFDLKEMHWYSPKHRPSYNVAKCLVLPCIAFADCSWVKVGTVLATKIYMN